MNKNINIYLQYYLGILFIFACFFLYQKHSVGNDSTISEWIINYSGSFTKRGLIGQISLLISKIFDINLRDVILIFQITLIAIYFFLIYNLLKNTKTDQYVLLSIFTPIFLLYPIAEIEVLARKEIFIFSIFLVYLLFPSKNFFLKNLYKVIFLVISVLIWEPVIFFILFWFAIEIIENKYRRIDVSLVKSIAFYLPAFLIAIYIALNPISDEHHTLMVNNLKNNFNEECYMSCALLKSKSSIYQQFAGNFGKYSLEIFVRYFLIIIIGFGPLFLLLKNSKIKNQKLLFFNIFKNLLNPFLIILSPVLLLFAMGYDWGRWVNISYVFSITFYVYLLKKNMITRKKINFDKRIRFNKKFFVYIFIIYCFGWNPKTVITGDIASFPGYRIPYKAFKIVNQKYLENNDF